MNTPQVASWKAELVSIFSSLFSVPSALGVWRHCCYVLSTSRTETSIERRGGGKKKTASFLADAGEKNIQMSDFNYILYFFLFPVPLCGPLLPFLSGIRSDINIHHS